MITVDEMARIAYEAYGVSGGWKTFDNRSMPAWDKLLEPTRYRWRQAAIAVLEAARAENVSRETSSEE